MGRNHPVIRKLTVSLGFVVILILLLLVGAQPGRAATLTVAAGVVDIDDADGQCSLIEAIINANNDAATHPDCPAGNGADVIELAANATYTITQWYNGDGLPDITDDLTIEGHNAILTRDPAQVYNIRYFDNAVDNALTIRNLTVENGSRQHNGGAIINWGRLEIVGSTFRNNAADVPGYDATFENGGAIYQEHTDATLIVKNSTFENNYTGYGGDGGAICSWSGGSVKIINSTFTGNGMNRPDHGGAVFFFGGGAGAVLEIRNSTFTGNRVSKSPPYDGHGGAVYVSNAAEGSYIAYSAFDGNESIGGGAVYISYHTGYFEVDHSTFTNNVANDFGGGAISGDNFHLLFSTLQGNIADYGGAIGARGSFTLTQTALIGNIAAGNGGGIYVEDNSTPVQDKISQSEISENMAGLGGGGIYVGGNADLLITNSTLSGNRGNETGGGLYVADTNPNDVQVGFSSIVSNSGGTGVGGFYLGSGSTMSMRNTVLANNTTDASGSATCDSDGAFTSGDYNRFPNSALAGCASLFTAAHDVSFVSPTGNIDLTLQNNGGRTRTHAVIAGGVLANEIPDGVNGCQAGARLDQRGYTRAGGGGAGGSQCDVGAYELNAVCDTPVAPVVAIAISNADAVLSWTKPAETYSTELWRSADPYFDPTSPGNKTPHNTLDETYTFYNDAGDAGDSNHYYAIRGLSGCGTASAAVERVGEFDFGLTPGAP